MWPFTKISKKIGCDFLVLSNNRDIENNQKEFSLYINVREFYIDEDGDLEFEADSIVKKWTLPDIDVLSITTPVIIPHRAYFYFSSISFTNYVMYGIFEYNDLKSVVRENALTLNEFKRIDLEFWMTSHQGNHLPTHQGQTIKFLSERKGKLTND
mgnify:CR=1 FL=1